MSLKIKISKNNIISEPRPVKRRKQRIDSEDDDDDEGVNIPYEPPAESSRRKKARTMSRGSVDDDYADADVDVEVDVDGDIEDTRFLPEPLAAVSRSVSPAPPAKRRLSSAAGSSSKTRLKEPKPAKSKPSAKRSRRAVVWTDDEDDDDFDDPDVVVTDDDDFEPEADYKRPGAGKGKSGKVAAGRAAGRSKTVKEEKDIIFRDERKLPTSVPESSKRSRPQDESQKSIVPAPLDLVDEASLPKKRKLPTIKKNKPSTAGSTAPSTPSTIKPVAPVAEKTQTLLTPAPTSNQVGTRKPAGASADLNLLDSSVYSELFKSKPGLTTPNSGLNRKQKEEERKKELHRMRDEARAKRDAEAKNAFDLQASPDKVERFVLHRLRHSTARFPNVLGATFKEMHDRTRVPASGTAQPR